MVVIVCGDRNWTDLEAVRREVAKLGPGTVVVDGTARGADTCGHIVACEFGLHNPRFKPDWETQHRAAGVIRNAAMLKYLLVCRAGGQDVAVLAFHTNLAESKGTKDMVTRARKAGVRVEVFEK